MLNFFPACSLLVISLSCMHFIQYCVLIPCFLFHISTCQSEAMPNKEVSWNFTYGSFSSIHTDTYLFSKKLPYVNLLNMKFVWTIIFLGVLGWSVLVHLFQVWSFLYLMSRHQYYGRSWCSWSCRIMVKPLLNVKLVTRP